MKSILDELKWRGILKQVTNEDKVNNAQNSGAGIYCGFDPTANSLHVGHLIQIMNLKRFKNFGFSPIALIGGGTGMIGDPSFKAAERKLLTIEAVDDNVKGIKAQLERMIPDVKVMNNADWLRSMSLIDFLRFVGKDFNLSYLLAKDNIASRINIGLSITEFAYTMLQAYDFFQLYSDANCLVQIGGSDQWGNITSGTDYISSRVGNENSKACGVTMNLLTKKDGVKFGKTESGAVWLDSAKTSEYEFYQFFINQEDDDCEVLLKYLTFLSEDEINNIIIENKKEPFKKMMQTKVAEEVTKFVHGEVGLEKAKRITKAFFEGTLNELSREELVSTFTSIPYTEFVFGETLINFLVKNNIAISNREARELLGSGAILVNGQKLTDENQIIDKTLAIHENIFIVKKGKRKYFAVEIK